MDHLIHPFSIKGSEKSLFLIGNIPYERYNEVKK